MKKILQIIMILVILVSCDKEESISTPSYKPQDTIKDPTVPVIPLSYNLSGTTWEYDGSPSESFIFDFTECTKIDYTGNSSKFSYKVSNDTILFGRLDPDNNEINWKPRFKIENINKSFISVFDIDRCLKRVYLIQ
jgi:hypothetical protein